MRTIRSWCWKLPCRLRSLQCHCTKKPPHKDPTQLHSSITDILLLQFDELTAGKSVGIYKSAKWSHFAAVDGSKKASNSYGPYLTPFSKPNLAHLKSGKKGIISFGYENGTAPGPPSQYPLANFYSFRYGCALPSTTPATVRVPVACSVQVKAQCATIGQIVPPAPATPFNYTVQYKPSNNLAYYQGDPAKDAGYYCYNYTMTAMPPGVDLYLDEVLYGTLRQRF